MHAYMSRGPIPRVISAPLLRACVCGTHTAAPSPGSDLCTLHLPKKHSLSQSELSTACQCLQQLQYVKFLSGTLPVGAAAMYMLLTVCVQPKSPTLCKSFQVSPDQGQWFPVQHQGPHSGMGREPLSCIFSLISPLLQASHTGLLLLNL